MKTASSNGHTKSSRLPPVSNGPNGSADRGADGRFLQGNPGGPGNPHVRHLASLRRAVTGAVDEGRLRRIMLKLADMAEAGDIAAAALVLSYCVGKPTPAVDPDGVDRLELDALLAGPTIVQIVEILMGRASAAKAMELVRKFLGDEKREEEVRAGILDTLDKIDTLNKLRKMKGNQSGPYTYDTPATAK
jgi:hypothetical protein